MKWTEALYDVFVYGLTALVSAVAGGILWLVRRVIVHQKQIELLQQDLDNREKQRVEDRKEIHEIKDTVKDTHALLANMAIKQNQGD